MGKESGGTRLEISPTAGVTRDYFLHVFDAADPSRAAGPSATLQQDGASATVTIDDGAQIYTVQFAKTGPMGGHLTVKSQAGATLCDQALGAGAQPPPDGGSPPGSDGGSPAAGDGGPAATLAKGCGCHLGAPVPAPLAFLSLLALAVILSRRRR